MKQLTLAVVGFERYGKTARRVAFLAEMERVVPWSALCAPIEPFYPKPGDGRPAVGVERMLRIYLLRASAVPYGQAGENAMRSPHLAHRSAAAHKLHSTTATTQAEFDPRKGETFSRPPALAYSSPEAVQTTGTVAEIGTR
jgi:IS5 family transposase